MKWEIFNNSRIWNPMTPIDYMKQKNQIIFDLTGIWLIPDDQLEQVEPKPLNVNSDGECCPYCVVYGEDSCNACPMKKVGNQCELDDDNTYGSVTDALEDNISTLPAIQDLVNKYNKENGFE